MNFGPNDSSSPILYDPNTKRHVFDKFQFIWSGSNRIKQIHRNMFWSSSIKQKYHLNLEPLVYSYFEVYSLNLLVQPCSSDGKITRLKHDLFDSIFTEIDQNWPIAIQKRLFSSALQRKTTENFDELFQKFRPLKAWQKGSVLFSVKNNNFQPKIWKSLTTN